MIHYVYFISCGDNKNAPIKIGMSKNISNRMSELQTGNPYKLTLLSAIECSTIKRAYNLEGYIHHKLRKHRLEGEWFRRSGWSLKGILDKYDKRIDKEKGVFRKLTNNDFKRELLEENRKLRERVKQLEDDIESYLDSEITIDI